MSWTAADIPDQTGRTAVVTGANGGLGLETARALAGAGAHVVMAARNQEKAQTALADIRGGHPDASLELVELDLASLDSVRVAADTILAAHPSIDILVNNAGVMGIPEKRTADGFEMQFGVNHLGHYALTALLLRALARGSRPRIVTVSSTVRHIGRPVDPSNPNLEGKYGKLLGPWVAYARSKLANYHFALGLHERLSEAGSPVESLVAHPGLSYTDLQLVSVEETGGGPSQRFFHSVAGRMGMKASDGALSQLRAATDPAAKGGELYAPRYGNNGPPVNRRVIRSLWMDGAVKRLWEVSEQATGLQIDMRGATPQSVAS